MAHKPYRQGVTKSDLIQDKVENAPGVKNPATLLQQVRKAGDMGQTTASARVSPSMKAKLRAKRPD